MLFLGSGLSPFGWGTNISMVDIGHLTNAYLNAYALIMWVHIQQYVALHLINYHLFFFCVSKIFLNHILWLHASSGLIKKLAAVARMFPVLDLYKDRSHASPQSLRPCLCCCRKWITLRQLHRNRSLLSLAQQRRLCSRPMSVKMTQSENLPIICIGHEALISGFRHTAESFEPGFPTDDILTLSW